MNTTTVHIHIASLLYSTLGNPSLASTIGSMCTDDDDDDLLLASPPPLLLLPAAAAAAAKAILS
jgi:hypothetical protein